MTEQSSSTDAGGAYAIGPLPFHELLGIRLVSTGAGGSCLRLTVEQKHLRDGGIMHGGAIATLIDAAVGVAARSQSHGGADFVTIQLSVNFVRAARVGDVLLASADVQHPGRRTVVARAEVRSEAGELIALGSGALFRVGPEPDKA